MHKSLAPKEQAMLANLWAALEGDPAIIPVLTVSGSSLTCDSPYEVADFATVTVAACSLALAEFDQQGRASNSSRRPLVDRNHAYAAFQSERRLQYLEKEVAGPWDDLSGNYRTLDGFIRLHANYSYHREAVQSVLPGVNDRATAEQAVAGWDSQSLETAVVSAGGCAARLQTTEQFLASEHGMAVARQPLVHRSSGPCVALPLPNQNSAVDNPKCEGILSGLRVLDLTRVIAGPVCTRVLAAQGAEVLRIDPIGFAEVPVLLADTTVGKYCATLDLKSSEGRERFEACLEGADVLIHGYRPEALADLGYSAEQLQACYPNLIIGQLSAYGTLGPWGRRRGFDSLVQMSTGIAHTAMKRSGAEHPVPLPVQALDHGTGYLLAAAVLRSLTRYRLGLGVDCVSVSLARTALFLQKFLSDSRADDLDFDAAPFMETTMSEFGGVKRVTCPVRVADSPCGWNVPAGSLGRSEARWRF